MVRSNEVIVEEIELSYEGPVDVQEVNAHLKSLFKKRGYRVSVSRHGVSTSSGKRTIKNKFDASKVVDDYHRIEASYEFSVKKYKDVKVGKKKLADAQFVFKVEVELLRDFAREWSKGSPMQLFIRSLYDKYIAGYKESRLANEVKEEIESLVQDLKLYLGME